MKKKSFIAGESCEYSICLEEDIDILKNILKKGQSELFGKDNKSCSKVENLENIVEYSKILSDKTRVNILYLIYIKGSLCVCDLANVLDMSSQAISSQLIKLYDKGILRKEKKGLTVFYSLLDEEFVSFLKHNL